MLDAQSVVSLIGPPSPDALPPPRAPAPRAPLLTQRENRQDDMENAARRVAERLVAAPPAKSPNPLVLPEHRDGASYRRREGAAFVNDVSGTDLTGGQANDCYFIASVSAIAAMRPEMIHDIIRGNQDGTFTARFYNLDSGRPVRLTVDGALPYKDDKPLYGTSSDRYELWGPVLEKAYAAHYGGYEAMGEKGGVAQYAMAELTGFTARSILTSSGVTKTAAAMEQAARERRPMLAQTNAHVLSGCGVRRKGVTDNHSYAVLDVQRTTAGVFVVLRDPMANSEFRSKAYDTDYALPGTKARRGDGIFRVRMDDFTKHFFNVVVMTDTPLPTPTPLTSQAGLPIDGISTRSTFTLAPPAIETKSHIARANPRPPPLICQIPA